MVSQDKAPGELDLGPLGWKDTSVTSGWSVCRRE